MKNPIDRLPWSGKALVYGLAAVAIVACEKRLDQAGKPGDNNQVASSSAVLIGTTPAPPTRAEGQPPETTPVGQPGSSAAASTEITTYEEARKMPLPGQPNDHSNVASDASQRAGQVDPQSMPPRNGSEPNPPQRETATAGTYGQPQTAQDGQPAPKQ